MFGAPRLYPGSGWPSESSLFYTVGCEIWDAVTRGTK